MKQLFAIAVLITVLVGSASAQSCSVSLNATRQATWFDNNSNHSLWTIVITAGSLPVSNVSLNIQGDLAQFWEVVRVSGSLFRLPDWRIQAGGIPAGQSHVFGFIINNADVNSPVSVADTQCPNVSPVPSPSASASPAASASASPAASASPTIVNTPIPSPSPSASAGCALNVTQQRRSGAGGSWNESSSNFQIYDLTLTNTGSRALTSASVTFAIAADQEITQFWNLNRVGTSNTFNFEPFILPAVGATQTGPGYVLRTPLNSTSAGSSIASVTANCSA